jgi:hypothetical protein
MKETMSSVNSAIAARMVTNLANCNIGCVPFPLAPVSRTIVWLSAE